MRSGWHWECEVIAPCGEPIPGMSGATAAAATSEIRRWDIALTQGYSLRWVRVDEDEEVIPADPSRIAGRITVGRGARWFT